MPGRVCRGRAPAPWLRIRHAGRAPGKRRGSLHDRASRRRLGEIQDHGVLQASYAPGQDRRPARRSCSTPDHRGLSPVDSQDRRAISQGDERSITATPGRPVWLVSGFIGHDLSDSQADSAGSIPCHMFHETAGHLSPKECGQPGQSPLHLGSIVEVEVPCGVQLPVPDRERVRWEVLAGRRPVRPGRDVQGVLTLQVRRAG